MLNIYPSSAPSTLRLPQIPRRRRGGQPCNRNALHHGLYAVKNRTPLTEISSTLPLYPRLLDAGSEAVSQQLILRLMEETGRAYQQLSSVADNRSMIAWFNTTVRMVALVGRMKLDYLKRFRVGSDLQVASRQAEFLIHKSFWEKGIVPEAYSFRDNICKSDFNSLALSEALCPSVSRSPFPFLTPRQWAVLEPLLPPADRSGKRGRPSADPRKLLDAIFWKLAHGARWQDLPWFYPPMLTCRRYYRQLYLSGCLDTLYSALSRDLSTRGKVSLPALVKQGRVVFSENKVHLRRGLEKSWQMRTALLFLQQGCRALHAQRSQKARRYRLQHPGALGIARKKEQLARAPFEDELFSFTPIDLSNFGSDPENEVEPGMPVGKRAGRPPLHIDTGKYSFIPVDLGRFGSGEDEGGDEDEGDDEEGPLAVLVSMKGYDKLLYQCPPSCSLPLNWLSSCWLPRPPVTSAPASGSPRSSGNFSSVCSLAHLWLTSLVCPL